MPLPTEIQSALAVYDNNKGFWRRLFRCDQAAIRAIRSLKEINQTNFLKICQCFIENLPKSTQESYKVYQALLSHFDEIDFSEIPTVINTLYEAKLLKKIDLNQLKNLNAQQFKKFSSLITILSETQLLVQQNLYYITFHYEMPEKLDSSEKMLNHLMHDSQLNQESLTKFSRLLAQLQDKQLLTQENFEEVSILSIDTIPILTDLIRKFNSNKILIQKNFEAILQQTNALHNLISINKAIEKLKRIYRLDEESFNYIIENPNIAINITSVLGILSHEGLYTSANLTQLFDSKNLFLFNDETYPLIWQPLKTYLPILSSCYERQSIIDQIIELSRQEDPIEKIKQKIDNELNSEFNKHTVRKKLRFFSAPPPPINRNNFIPSYNFSRQLSL